MLAALGRKIVIVGSTSSIPSTGSGTSCDIATFGFSRVARWYFEIPKASCSSWQSNQARLLVLLPRHPEFHIWVAGPTLDPACLERPPKHPALSTGFHPIDSGSWPFWKFRSQLLQNSVHNWIRPLILTTLKHPVAPDPHRDILVGNLCNCLPLATAWTPHPRV